jgi:hypothetical protein
MGCAPSSSASAHPPKAAAAYSAPVDQHGPSKQQGSAEEGGAAVRRRNDGTATAEPKGRRNSPPVSEVPRASEQLESASSQRQRTPVGRPRPAGGDRSPAVSSRRSRCDHDRSGQGSQRQHRRGAEREPQSLRRGDRRFARRRGSSSSYGSEYSSDDSRGSGGSSRAESLRRRSRRHQPGKQPNRSRTSSRSDARAALPRQRADTSTRPLELERLGAELFDARALNPSADAPPERVPLPAETKRATLEADEQRRLIQRRRVSQRPQGAVSDAAGGKEEVEAPSQPGAVSPKKTSGGAGGAGDTLLLVAKNPHQTEEKRDRIRAWVGAADSELHTAVRRVQARWRAKLARDEFQLMRSCAGSSGSGSGSGAAASTATTARRLPPPAIRSSLSSSSSRSSSKNWSRREGAK